MQLTLNGREVDVATAEGVSLLELLRDECGLRSMKDGCAPEGSCGACTVIVDGRPVVSCAQPASRFAGRNVETLEGLADEVRRSWAQAFVGLGASQCGFCTPGIVMKAEALLRRVDHPSDAEVARALAGNVCRCTGYVSIVRAIQAVAAQRAGVEPASSGDPGGNAIGQPAPRYDGVAQVLGETQFVGDMEVPGMLHGAIRFADHPRARVLRIDTAAAAQHTDVVDVVTWRDIPGERLQGLISADWPVLVAETEETRYVGDMLAFVVARTRRAARAAAALVKVEYEVLRPITSPDAALEAGAPLLHPGGNLLSTSVVHRGDVPAALAGARHVESGTFTTQRIEHAFLEPEAALAVPDGDGLRVYAQGQGAWEDRRQIASLLALPQERIRVTQVATGGAFGGKEDLGPQAAAALLARLTKAPVLLKLSRAESLRFHPKRHPTRIEATLGCDADGRLVAYKARIVGDTGAYASLGAKVLERAAGHACGAYRVPNVDVESRAVYTNNLPCGAMRGFGVPQVTFAIEGLLDELAQRCGLDGWEMRWRNAVETGDRFGSGQVLGPGVGLKKTLLAVREAYRSARFAGIACGAKNTGIGNGVTEHGRAVVAPLADGRVLLRHSWTEMGQGIHTALRQVCAQELGIGADRIDVVVDTERELDTGETTASRATLLGGQAVLRAAQSLREALQAADWSDLVGQEFEGTFKIDWTTPIGPDVPDPVTHIGYGWATQVVILDDHGHLAKVVAAQDVGRAINPQILRGQVEGGVHMGLGYALSEDFATVDGVPVATTLKSLGIIPAAGMPEVETILVEEPLPDGPFGAKGAGEAVLVPTAAAVAGALRAFDGIVRRDLPMRDSPAARAALPRLAAVRE
ncbi:MAG: selenium-dependent xanthine dehydrogenase [Chloroflexota bacterium]